MNITVFPTNALACSVKVMGQELTITGNMNMVVDCDAFWCDSIKVRVLANKVTLTRQFYPPNEPNGHAIGLSSVGS